MVKAEVIEAHESEFPNPLKLAKGQLVDLKEHSTEWPGWIFAVAEDGNSGWIHKSYLIIDGSSGKIGVDYDATELNVDSGEKLDVLDTKSGWCLCQKLSGEIGWVPERNLSIKR